MTRIGNTYRRFHGYVANRPTNFSWIVNGKLAGSGMPMTFSQLVWTVKQGIKTIVTVREVSLPSKWFTERTTKDIDYLHLRVEDYGAPTLEELDNTVNFMKKQINNQKPVLVHCAAGKGRTGTILAAYLLKEDRLNADQTIKKIRNLRPGSIQSEVQEMAITMYEKYLTKNMVKD